MCARTVIVLGLLLCVGCGKTAICFTQADDANVHADFGYFYDSATLDVNGATTFARIPEGMTANPCLVPGGQP